MSALRGVPTRWMAGLALAGVALSMGGDVQAGLFVNPAGGELIFDDNADYDDIPVVPKPTPFTFNFFGTPQNQVSISVNGNLNFSQDIEFNNGPLSSTGVTPTTRTRIAPLWDDFAIWQGSSSRIYESKSLTYYAVTWELVSVFGDNSGDRMTFQTVIFDGPISLQGWQFQKGDILFAYDLLQAKFAGGTATVGLDSGDGIRVKLFPGSPPQGVLSDEQKYLLPLTGGFLFRDDGSNGYNASIIPVPEPETVAMAAGVCLLGWGLWRRRQG